MKIKKILLTSALLFSGVYSFNSYSAIIIPIETPFYGNQCATAIDATTFMPTAMTPIINTEVSLNTDLYLPVLTAIQQSSLNASQVISSAFKGISVNMLKQSQTTNLALLEIQKNNLESDQFKEERLRVLQNQINNTVYNDNNGNFTSHYYQQLCTKNKMLNIINDNKKREKESVVINHVINDSIAKSNSSSSAVSKAKSTQEENYKKYCSYDDNKDGLCDKVSPLQNGNLDANLFVYPVGYNLENTDYKTKYTYNDAESLAAKDYIETLVGNPMVDAPSYAESVNARFSRFTSFYKNLESLRNLSKYGFYQIWLNRQPIVEDKDKLSKNDFYGYIIHQFGDKVTQLESSGNLSSVDSSIYIAQALVNKLQMEIMLQQEIMNNLDAGTLSLSNNSASIQKYFINTK